MTDLLTTNRIPIYSTPLPLVLLYLILYPLPTGVTCTKSVSVEVFGAHYRLIHGGAVSLNNRTYDENQNIIGDRVSITHVAELFTVLIVQEYGLTVMWDGGEEM